ncbi:hypothetical protein [Brevundimonas subvibrioides]|uniref:hypothetical protein n=1 Tax=Brevundimonas subvibrioides TaxID=74313 RepID=UPI0022B47729|nr:hypothetical protein [Brevundimonas subvibrioides]
MTKRDPKPMTAEELRIIDLDDDVLREEHSHLSFDAMRLKDRVSGLMLRQVGLSCLISTALMACSPPNRLYEKVPFPVLTSMACTLEPVHNGVLNPTYLRESSRDALTFAITNLNAEAKTASLGGNNGAETVEYRFDGDQMQFIETTMTGNFTLTTVFAPPEVGKPMPAVHSRHIELSPANVSISQYAGECVAG